MKFFIIHCGFYDQNLCGGIYESHVNFFTAARNPEEARLQAKQIHEFKMKQMHVDGIQEISAINGYRIFLEKDDELNGQSIILSFRHRDLASNPTLSKT